MIMRKAPDSPTHSDDNNWPGASTPKRRKTTATGPALVNGRGSANGTNGTSDVTTPSKRARTTPKKPTTFGDSLNPSGLKTPTQKSKAKSLFSTPRKTTAATPSRAKNADRSAKRKSARVLFEHNDEDIWDGADRLAEEILDEEDASGNDANGNVIETLEKDSETPAPAAEAQPKRRAGRPKGAKNKRSPTPEGEIPPHERFFFQNRPGPPRTSNNNLNKMTLLTHEEYFENLARYEDPHKEEKEVLLELHQRSFPQWRFEFHEQFNICLYGYGSKRLLVQKFADWLYCRLPSPPTIIMVNGYTPNISVRSIFATIVSTILGDDTPSKLGAQPGEVLDFLQSTLQSRSSDQPVIVLINSIDAPPLRRTAIQAHLARLAAIPSINLLATVDTLNFATMWDLSLRDQFNFAFHDSTTFVPYDVEVNVVDEVHNLLGRRGRRIGGKDGVAFVLKSLPENARNLYRVLLTELLSIADGVEGNGGSDEEDNGGREGGPRHHHHHYHNTNTAEDPGIEFRSLYQKAAEEFIASSEMMFRTLLKEFHDHQMITSRMDATGTETLRVPLSRDEMEGVLEDLVLS